MKEKTSTLSAGIYYVLCIKADDLKGGSNCFVIDDEVYQSVFFSQDKDNMIYVKESINQVYPNARIAKIKFLETGKINANGKYEFLGWV